MSLFSGIPLDTSSPTDNEEDISERLRLLSELAASTERFRAVVEGLNEGVLLTDLADRVLYANPRICELTGYSESEFAGRPAYELLLSPEEWPILLDRNTSRAGGAAETYDVNLLRKDGTRFRARINAAPFRDTTGQIIGTIGATTDVTDQYRALQALRASEERYRLVTENLSEVISILSPEGVILSQNGALAPVLGYSPTEFVGRNGSDRVHPDDLPQIASTFLEAVALGSGGRTSPVIIRIQHKDGSWRWMESTAVNLTGEPAVGGILVTSRDVTARQHAEAERERLQQERAQIQAEARRRERMYLGEVLYSVTDGRLRLCSDADDLPELLPPPEPHPERFPAVPIHGPEALAEIRRQVRRAGESCGFSPERWYGLMGAASETAMNALLHGGGEAIARVGAAPDRGLLQVWVADRGRGIPVEELPRATLLRGYSGTAESLGQGFYLTLALCDHIHLLTGDCGTTVVLEQNISVPLDRVTASPQDELSYRSSDAPPST